MALFGSGIVKGMTVTARNLVGSYVDPERLTTIEYPEVRKKPEQNYRNFPFLVFDGEKDNLRCVACKICETECPPQCIYIEVQRDEKGKLVKRPRVFDIDYSVCMGCQICVEACPFDAIKMDQDFELATGDRFGGLLLNKDQLLKSNEYYHEIKPDEATEVDARLAREAEKKKSAASAKPAPKPASAPAKTASAPQKIQTTYKLMNVIIPPEAPFSGEQKDWLQKFFSSVLYAAPVGGSTSAPAAGTASAPTAEAPAATEGANPDLTNDAPWHDPDKPISERLEMSKGKDLAVRLYSAMGQTDCTACGYDCKGYAQALAAGTEKDPGLCVPGADETAAKVKELLGK